MNHSEKVTLMYLNETFSSPLLHTILLIIEYYPLILFTSTIGYIFCDYSFDNTNSANNTHKTLKFLLFVLSDKGFPNIFNLSLFIVIAILSLIYYPLIAFSLRRSHVFKRIICNIYDLLYFRYFSFYVIIYFVNIIHNNNNSIAVCIVNIVFCFIYLIQVIIHNTSVFSIFPFSNKELSSNIIKYPFDYFYSLQFNNSKIIIKILLAIIYVIHNTKYYHKIVFLMCTLFVISILIYQLYIIINIFYLNFLLRYFVLNSYYNMSHTIAIIYSCLNVIVISFINNKHYSNSLLILLLFGNLFWSI